MKIQKKWKRAAATMMAAVMLSGSLTAQVMAHGHGCGQHGYSNSSRQAGVYCVYHDKMHKSKSKCKRYCLKHKTIHKSGKRHAVKHHAAI